MRRYHEYGLSGTVLVARDESVVLEGMAVDSPDREAFIKKMKDAPAESAPTRVR